MTSKVIMLFDIMQMVGKVSLCLISVSIHYRSADNLWSGEHIFIETHTGLHGIPCLCFIPFMAFWDDTLLSLPFFYEHLEGKLSFSSFHQSDWLTVSYIVNAYKNMSLGEWFCKYRRHFWSKCLILRLKGYNICEVTGIIAGVQ